MEISKQFLLWLKREDLDPDPQEFIIIVPDPARYPHLKWHTYVQCTIVHLTKDKHLFFEQNNAISG